ncbi:endonuclease VII domain-containing protein [Streptomyces sp. enrichment culture]|uniref:endonuclease VII domain-containing protein n=1 Tax=Streptomyces sp. enrichment culture TaxID=1795815 RepID=UPI003F562A1A
MARCNSAAHPRRRREALRKRVPIASQGGVCCVCLSAVPAHVDHCHETGRVRGVLCFSCNAALGQFKNQPDVMRRAAAYVEGNAWKPTLVAPGVYQLPS